MQSKRLNNKLLRRIGISIVLLIVVAIVIYGVVHKVGKTAENLAVLEKAAVQWLAHPIRHYRLSIKYSGMLWAGSSYHECVQDAEVVDEQTGTVFQDTCREQGEYVQRYFVSPVTVTGLFARLKDEMTRLGAAEDMLCYGVLIVQATYDPLASFPVSAVYSTERPSADNLGTESYWRLYGSGATVYKCLVNSGPMPPTITVSLEPLFT